MSVIILGMNLPEYCYDCPCHNGEHGYCQISKDYIMGVELPENCPLVAVPPHGDLIDRDAAYDKIAEQEGGNYVDMDAVDKGLEETPVVIPAEEEA